MHRVLLIDDDEDHAGHLDGVLTERGFIVIHVADHRQATAMLRNRTTVCDLVILSMAHRSRAWLTVLRDLQEAGTQARFLEVPQFLCVSRFHLGADLQLQIERMGARYACEE
jgi:DNA-binding response OmpR family regulator